MKTKINVKNDLHKTISIGFRLKEARKKAGYKSARDFAQKHNIKERTYRSHENGEYEAPLDVLLKYCYILNASPSWLILGSEAFADKPFSKDNPDFEWLSKLLESGE